MRSPLFVRRAIGSSAPTPKGDSAPHELRDVPRLALKSAPSLRKDFGILVDHGNRMAHVVEPMGEQ